MREFNWDLPKQTLMVNREIGQNGDCWRCCIAALMQMPALELPHFLQLANDEGTHDCDQRTQAWLNERNHILIETDRITLPAHYKLRPKLPYIACGPTQRSRSMGQHHAVIMIADQLMYDPHPDNTGLTAVIDRYLVMPMP